MILKAAQEQSQRPRSKLTEHQTCNAAKQRGYMTLAIVAKCATHLARRPRESIFIDGIAGSGFRKQNP